jgi:hypothetical protein
LVFVPDETFPVFHRGPPAVGRPCSDKVAILFRRAGPALGSQGFVFLTGHTSDVEAQFVIFGAISGFVHNETNIPFIVAAPTYNGVISEKVQKVQPRKISL